VSAHLDQQPQQRGPPVDEGVDPPDLQGRALDAGVPALPREERREESGELSGEVGGVDA